MDRALNDAETGPCVGIRPMVAFDHSARRKYSAALFENVVDDCPERIRKLKTKKHCDRGFGRRIREVDQCVEE